MILNPNLAGNGLGRSYILAELLRDDFDVRITGPLQEGSSAWSVCLVDGIPVEPWCDHMPRFGELADQAGQFDADVIIATKAHRNSFGLALLARRRRRTPLLLDIDEWDVPTRGRTAFGKWARTLLRPWKWWRLWELGLDALAGRADAITVSCSFLKDRYGGSILPHVRDVRLFDPARVDGRAARRRLKVGDDEKLVLFLGTPRRHKGVEDVGAAVESLGRGEVRFLVVGASPGDPYVEKFRKRCPGATLHPPCSLNDAPAFLAAADVVVVPQRDTNFARSQLPAKLVDAMAMGRPIVATSVSDIPRLLDGCGLVVKPGDAGEIASAIRWVIQHPAEAAEMGSRARARAARDLSHEAGRPVLLRAVEEAMANSSPARTAAAAPLAVN
ncbi:MAG: glycosyltransferase [Planctomycetota bacterium]